MKKNQRTEEPPESPRWRFNEDIKEKYYQNSGPWPETETKLPNVAITEMVDEEVLHSIVNNEAHF